MAPDAIPNGVLAALDDHYTAFHDARRYADATHHPVPCDTRAWSQIIVSLLTGIMGRGREKGSDLRDGSDVKAANVWSAIDTPRFNGVLPAGRVSATSRKATDLSALDDVPMIFFVLWDTMSGSVPRCRIWCVRPREDQGFRGVCAKWYEQLARGEVSNNFQLHPPRNLDHNVIRNVCGNMELPLLLCAVRREGHYTVVAYDPCVLQSGSCRVVPDPV